MVKESQNSSKILLIAVVLVGAYLFFQTVQTQEQREFTGNIIKQSKDTYYCTVEDPLKPPQCVKKDKDGNVILRVHAECIEKEDTICAASHDPNCRPVCPTRIPRTFYIGGPPGDQYRTEWVGVSGLTYDPKSGKCRCYLGKPV